MNAKTRLERLEKAKAPQGHCQCLPPIVRYFAPDGSETTYSEPQGQSDSERALTCNCGRERLTIKVCYTLLENMPQAKDLSDDELNAIIARRDTSTL